MPAKTRRQQQFMAICAHQPGIAKGKCPPKKVAMEYSHMGKSKKNKKVK
jgi:hypothetical protein